MLKQISVLEMLREFNEGRSKSYYCIAATVLDIEELSWALTKARNNSSGLQIKQKSKLLHSILDDIAAEKNYLLKLRKKVIFVGDYPSSLGIAFPLFQQRQI